MPSQIFDGQHLFISSGYGKGCIMLAVAKDGAKKLFENKTVQCKIQAPILDGKSPSEQDLLVNGTYNLGFIGVRNSPQGIALLDWWEERVLNLGFSEGRTGLFVNECRFISCVNIIHQKDKVAAH